MELAETQFVTIDGTKVTVAVDSADEARLAIKELRHKKKEIGHLRRAAVRRKRAAEALASSRKPRSSRRKQTVLQRIGGVIGLLAALPFAYGKASRIMDLPELERECARLDDLLHSLDSCLLQIEGRLIHMR